MAFAIDDDQPANLNRVMRARVIAATAPDVEGQDKITAFFDSSRALGALYATP